MFIPYSRDSEIVNIEYTSVDEIAEEYVDSRDDKFVYLKLNTPQMVIGGIKAPWENGGVFYRLDGTKIAEDPKYYENLINGGVATTAHCTTGGTIRFCTDASEVMLVAEMGLNWGADNKFNGRGAFGFDVYMGTGTDRAYVGLGNETYADRIKLNQLVDFDTTRLKEALINMPLYSGVKNIIIGFPHGTRIASPLTRAHKPYCIYGSSITQGALAQRPGLAFTNLVSRMLDIDCINQGYSGADHGEPTHAEYISKIDMSLFVYDYYANSTADEHAERHYPFYKIFREAQPETPIIMMTWPLFNNLSAWDAKKWQTVYNTYNRAIAEGDRNVYFIDGFNIFPEKNMLDIYHVDKVHPNSHGMYHIAKALYPVMNKILNG